MNIDQSVTITLSLRTLLGLREACIDSINYWKRMEGNWDTSVMTAQELWDTIDGIVRDTAEQRQD